MKKIIALILVVLVLGYLYIVYEQRDRKLSESPPNQAEISQFNTKPSSIAVSVRLPFAQLTNQANKSAPKNYSDKGNGPDKCGKVLFQKVCVGTKYNYTVNRGNISIGPGSNNTIRISVPFNISGQGGFRGDGARLLKLDKKNFRAGVIAHANIGLDIDSNWCPKPSVAADFNWTQGARVEIVGGVWVGISGAVEGSLRDQVKSMGNSVASLIKCKDIKDEVQKVWKSYSFPVDIPGSSEKAHVNIKPKSFGFSGVRISSDAANIAFSLDSHFDIALEPETTKQLPLPALKRISATKSALSIAVPMKLPFKLIQEQLAEGMIDSPVSFDSPTGVSTVTAREIRVYPAGKSVAIGALLDINLPDRWLDVSGWVYLSTEPLPAAGGTALKLNNPTFSRVLNNELWNIISVVLENTIKKEINVRALIDLKEPINLATKTIQAEASKNHQGFSMQLGSPKISLGRIETSKDQLIVEGLFHSKADITLEAF